MGTGFVGKGPQRQEAFLRTRFWLLLPRQNCGAIIHAFKKQTTGE
jgi:hypothetical protein